MTLLKKGLVVAKADLQKTLGVLPGTVPRCAGYQGMCCVLGGENFLQETHR